MPQLGWLSVGAAGLGGPPSRPSFPRPRRALQLMRGSTCYRPFHLPDAHVGYGQRPSPEPSCVESSALPDSRCSKVCISQYPLRTRANRPQLVIDGTGGRGVGGLASSCPVAIANRPSFLGQRLAETAHEVRATLHVGNRPARHHFLFWEGAAFALKPRARRSRR